MDALAATMSDECLHVELHDGELHIVGDCERVMLLLRAWVPPGYEATYEVWTAYEPWQALLDELDGP